jgi:hypothetical protein
MDFQKVLEMECSICKKRSKGTYKALVNSGWKLLTAFPKCRECAEKSAVKGDKGE